MKWSIIKIEQSACPLRQSKYEIVEPHTFPSHQSQVPKLLLITWTKLCCSSLGSGKAISRTRDSPFSFANHSLDGFSNLWMSFADFVRLNHCQRRALA